MVTRREVLQGAVSAAASTAASTSAQLAAVWPRNSICLRSTRLFTDGSILGWVDPRDNGPNTMPRILDPFGFVLIAVAGWMNQRQPLVIDYLVLREQLEGRRPRLNDDQRCRLAVKANGLGRRVLFEVASIVTPETLLAWYQSEATPRNHSSEFSTTCALANPGKTVLTDQGDRLRLTHVKE